MYRVLLADDEQIERMALAKRLRKHFGDSLRICEAADGADALEVYKRERSQIVIMDISMPELDGITAAERIRGMDEDCVIIFLTAYNDFSYAKRAIVIRALDYLLKPCEDEELAAVMEEAMRLTDRRLEWRAEAGRGQPAGSGVGKAELGAGVIDPAARKADERAEAESLGREAAGERGADESIGVEGEGRLAQAAETIREYIRSNYMKEISMQDGARMMNYSDAYFCKLFKQCFDQNFTAYLTNFRINEAKRLLKDRNASVKDVSMQVGYYDSNYFAKVFKRVTGMIPSEYRDGQGAQK